MLLNGSRRSALLIDGKVYLSRRIIAVTTWSAVDPDVKTGSAPLERRAFNFRGASLKVSRRRKPKQRGKRQGKRAQREL